LLALRPGRRFVERDQRPQNLIDADDRAAVQPAQGGRVLDRPGVGHPRRQKGFLFGLGQPGIAHHVVRMHENLCRV
jgi:hypothetical protein